VLALFRRVATSAAVGIVVGLIATQAWSQEPPPSGTTAQPPPPATAAPPTVPTPAAPIPTYPLELLGLLAPPAQRGPLTLFPSIAVSEEYNDNVHGDNRHRESDFITNFSPTITLSVNRPSYQLNAGYSFTAAVYAEGTLPNEAFQSQNFIGSGSWQVARGVTLGASDSFAYNKSATNLVAVQGFSVGQQESLSNTFSPRVSWQMTPLDTLSFSAIYGVLRFLGGGTGEDSDTYGISAGLSHHFTQRFAGNIGYGFTYLHFPECLKVGSRCINQPDSSTHTPTIGFNYQLTPTLTTSVNGGAAITERSGRTEVSPAGNASLIQQFSFGTASLNYNQGVSVAGGFGGSNDTLSLSGLLTLSTLLRNLVVVLGPSYNRSDPVVSQAPGQSSLWSVSLNLGASYQIARFVSAYGGYTFFVQRSSGSSTGSSTQANVDQNRVRFGLQFGYPINFD
jgi:long-subunit fatty acid transport protein